KGERLESVWTLKAYRGFESHSLRQYRLLDVAKLSSRDQPREDAEDERDDPEKSPIPSVARDQVAFLRVARRGQGEESAQRKAETHEGEERAQPDGDPRRDVHRAILKRKRPRFSPRALNHRGVRDGGGFAASSLTARADPRLTRN